MNSPVALLATREAMDFLSTVSIVSISTFNLSEADFSSEAAMVYFSGSPFSHFGFQTFRAAGVDMGVGREAGAEIFSGFCMSGKSVSESCIFDRILKRLQVDSEGMLFTRCLVQNPPPVQLFLPDPTAAPLSMVSPS